MKDDKYKEGAAKSEDIIDIFTQKYGGLHQPLFDDPTCIDGAQGDDDDEDDDDVIDIEWALEPPELEVINEQIICRNNKSWVNLVIQYERQEDAKFEYIFDIEEVDG